MLEDYEKEFIGKQLINVFNALAYVYDIGVSDGREQDELEDVTPESIARFAVETEQA
jgi:hypothetical protein